MNDLRDPRSWWWTWKYIAVAVVCVLVGAWWDEPASIVTASVVVAVFAGAWSYWRHGDRNRW